MTQDLKRYDIVLVNFGENMDSEQDGIRPAIIIQNDKGNYFSKTTIVMPLTSKMHKSNLPTHTLIKKGKEKGLVSDSIVLGECIRQISEKRIVKFLGSITNESEQVAIRKVFLANFGE